MELNAQITLAKDAYIRRCKLLKQSTSLTVMKKIVKVVMWSVFLYGCKAWHMKKDEIKRDVHTKKKERVN